MRVGPDSVLIAVFSYNRPLELARCLHSVAALCSDYPVLIADDNSDDPDVHDVIACSGAASLHGNGGTERHGGLYDNMQQVYEYAAASGYGYLLTLQDDMQVVRALDRNIADEYTAIFGGDHAVTQVDPRFVRGTGDQLVPCAHIPAFAWRDERGRCYADVGLFDLARLAAVRWQFAESENSMRLRGAEMGLRRVFPFTPIAMHTPYPNRFRRRARRRRQWHTKRGTCSFRTMTPDDKERMDSRPKEYPPMFREFLTVDGLSLLGRLHFRTQRDDRIFR